MDAVVCITDRKYLIPTQVMLSSLCDHLAPGIEVFVLSKDVTLEDFSGFHFSSRVTGVIDHSNLSIFAEVSQRRFRGKTHVTADAMAKLQLPFMFSSYRRVLYLDGDMVCCSSEINDLFEIDLGESLVAAVPDYKRARDAFRANLGVQEDEFYFNSGLVLFDIENFRETFTERLVADKTSALAGKVRFVDQDTLNYLCRGRVHYLGLKFNVFANVHMGNDVTLPLEDVIPKAGPTFLAFPESQLHDAMASRVMLHYTSSSKPWKTDCGHDDLWWKECARLDVPFRRSDRPGAKAEIQKSAKQSLARLKKALTEPQAALRRTLRKAYLGPIKQQLDLLASQQRALQAEVRRAHPIRVRCPVIIDLSWASEHQTLTLELARIFENYSFELACCVLLDHAHGQRLNLLADAWKVQFVDSLERVAPGIYFKTPVFGPTGSALHAEYLSLLSGEKVIMSEPGEWIQISPGSVSTLVAIAPVGPSLVAQFSDRRYDSALGKLYRVAGSRADSSN